MEVCANLVVYDWWKEASILKEELRCAWEAHGGQCVMMAGTAEMLVSSVLNWDSHQQASNLLLIFSCIIYVCTPSYVHNPLLGQRLNRDPTLKFVGLRQVHYHCYWFIFYFHIYLVGPSSQVCRKYFLCTAANSSSVPCHNPKKLEYRIANPKSIYC